MKVKNKSKKQFFHLTYDGHELTGLKTPGCGWKFDSDIREVVEKHDGDHEPVGAIFTFTGLILAGKVKPPDGPQTLAQLVGPIQHEYTGGVA